MFYPSLAPEQSDTNVILWNKALQLLNQLNGAASSEPTFYPEGSEAELLDCEHKLIQKVVGASFEYSGKA